MTTLLITRRNLSLIAIFVAGLALTDSAAARTRRPHASPAQPTAAEVEREQDMVAARMSLRAAQHDVAMVAPRTMYDLEQSPSYRDALYAQQQATAAFESARARVLA